MSTCLALVPQLEYLKFFLLLLYALLAALCRPCHLGAFYANTGAHAISRHVPFLDLTSSQMQDVRMVFPFWDYWESLN